MYKIIESVRDCVEDIADTCDDPYIIDVRNFEDKFLKEFYRRDYINLVELSNRGITKVIFKSPIRGKMRFLKILKRAQDFDREIIVLHNDLNHFKYLRRMISEWRKEFETIPG